MRYVQRKVIENGKNVCIMHNFSPENFPIYLCNF